MENKTNEAEASYSSSVDKALAILEYISIGRNGVSLAELVKALDMPKTTVFRLLETLKSRGYVELLPQSDLYSLGLKAIDLGASALGNREIVDVSAPYLREIAETTGETSFLGVYNEGEVVYLYKAEGTRSIRISSQLGSRRPVHCTGLGKAILSAFPLEEVDRILFEKGMPKYTESTITTLREYHEELSQIRSLGVAKDAEELEQGLSCFAAPIFNFTGYVVGAICISGPTERIEASRQLLIKALREACQQISRRLGFVPTMRSFINK
ncbi:IclR family transcriptional regulator [Ammoniphilus resinae]|uniref:DNA-binding IclR family transcriptional regulator n=1 Tax=Ammoniphilus resinae TaxID=861532 RepID=A0ABS4GWB3_9BACL|nr:IclR family transcriptional regulator [Ammoniphilus resinae]MBP1934559.1 DNA-binding IclR family transcriptional regulator [Ammoniphilus resinae]